LSIRGFGTSTDDLLIERDGESLIGTAEEVNIFGPKTLLVFVVDAGPDENKPTDNLCRRGGFV
jgi:hypothetical protein